MDDETAMFVVDDDDVGTEILCYDCTHAVVRLCGGDLECIVAVLTPEDEYPGVCDACGA